MKSNVRHNSTKTEAYVSIERSLVQVKLTPLKWYESFLSHSHKLTETEYVLSQFLLVPGLPEIVFSYLNFEISRFVNEDKYMQNGLYLIKKQYLGQFRIARDYGSKIKVHQRTIEKLGNTHSYSVNMKDKLNKLVEMYKRYVKCVSYQTLWERTQIVLTHTDSTDINKLYNLNCQDAAFISLLGVKGRKVKYDDILVKVYVVDLDKYLSNFVHRMAQVDKSLTTDANLVASTLKIGKYQANHL